MSIKGQLLSSDFLIASSIFIIVTAIIFSYWTYTTIQIEENRKIDDIIDAAFLASNVWMREGTPNYWNSTNVVDIGLQNNHRFNETKLVYLNEIGYSKVKSMIGLTQYNLYLRIYDFNNNTFFTFGNFSSNAENVVKIKRIGLLNNTIVYVDTVVWE